MTLTRQYLAAALTALSTLLDTPAQAQAQPATPDFYAATESWLCRPGRQDLCTGNQDTTVIAADGSRRVAHLQPDPNAPIDCFYVYPTVSQEPTGNSSWTPGPGEKKAIEQQFSRFASVCKPYAPMYRQITLAGLRGMLLGSPIPMQPELGYSDILAAWRYYLAHDNQGRGVVLVGHSQGALVLAQLIKREIEGKPVQAQVVSALLPGSTVEVPPGADHGGTFQQMPVCTAIGQTGCVVVYASFRASAPPSANARFGRARTPGLEAACTDPVALSGTPLHSLLPARSDLIGQTAQHAGWAQLASTLETPFVSLPGLLEAHCVSQDGAAYLAVSLHPPAGSTATDIPGDVLTAGRVNSAWGLHVVDVNLVAGNLLDLVRRQGTAYLARAAATPAKAQ